MIYSELKIFTTHIAGELIADVLWRYTDQGVVIDDVEDAIALEREGRAWDYAEDNVLDKDKPVTVTAYFPKAEAKEKIAAALSDINALKGGEFDLGSLEYTVTDIDGDGWREKWKEFFKPKRIGRVVIIPEWVNYPVKDGEIPVYISSNMAFGTGEHETTSMCIEYLQSTVKKNSVVLDVGCGSGILGITAEKLGAKKVLMTDIDELATEAAAVNCAVNGVKNAEILLKNLLDDNSVKGDVIVANIMADVLIFFADKIGDNLNEGGLIILSGILNCKLSEVRSAYERSGFTFVSFKTEGEWSALLMKKD